MKTNDINRMIQEMTERLGKKNDPVASCGVYKSKESCTHVDGYLCDMQTCDILKNFENLDPDRKKIYTSNRATKSKSEYKRNG